MGSQEYNLAVLWQIVKHIPGKLIEKLKIKHKIQTRAFSATSHVVTMIFAQLSHARKRLVSRMSEAGLNRQKQKSIILSDRQQHCRAIDSAGENPVEKWGCREVES